MKTIQQMNKLELGSNHLASKAALLRDQRISELRSQSIRFSCYTCNVGMCSTPGLHS